MNYLINIYKLNKMNRTFYKFTKKRFSQFHHDYDISKLPTNNIFNMSLALFDALRLLAYLYFGFKLIIKGPQIFAFITIRSRKPLHNNPDFRLCESSAKHKEVVGDGH